MKALKKLFTPAPATWGNFYEFEVKCKRCGEVIHGQVNVNNDPSVEYDDRGRPYYICRKVLVGNGHCFQQIEVFFRFNENRGILDMRVVGGEFVEE